MAAAALDPALVPALLGIFVACVAAALRYRRTPDAGSLARPWTARGWPHMLSFAEQQEARARAAEVARLTVGEEVWDAFTRDGYIDLPSEAEPGTYYRLRPARRVEMIQADMLATPGQRDYRRTCVSVRLPQVRDARHRVPGAALPAAAR